MEPLERFGILLKEDNPEEALVYGLACGYALLEREIASYLRLFNLTVAKFNALMVIKHRGKDKGLSQVEIGKSLIVSASNITRLLDRLYGEGLIQRLTRFGDRRVNLVKITAKGSRLLDKAWPGYYRKITRAARLLENKDLESVSEILIKWIRRFEENYPARNGLEESR